jgi:predicted transcriptional regulator
MAHARPSMNPIEQSSSSLNSSIRHNPFELKYRSRTEIISTVLNVTNNGASKTRIMYGAYLSYAQLKEYLEFLVERDLLRYEEGTQLYRLTSKGMQFLRAASQIQELIGMDSEGKNETNHIVTDASE